MLFWPIFLLFYLLSFFAHFRHHQRRLAWKFALSLLPFAAGQMVKPFRTDESFPSSIDNGDGKVPMAGSAPIFSAKLLIQYVQQQQQQQSSFTAASKSQDGADVERADQKKRQISMLGKRASTPSIIEAPIKNENEIEKEKELDDGEEFVDTTVKRRYHRHHQKESPEKRGWQQHRCERLTEREKYMRLESVGGRNQQFMANTPREAAHNFPSLLSPAADQMEENGGLDKKQQQMGKDLATEEHLLMTSSMSHHPSMAFFHLNDADDVDPSSAMFLEEENNKLRNFAAANEHKQCDQRCREVEKKLLIAVKQQQQEQQQRTKPVGEWNFGRMVEDDATDMRMRHNELQEQQQQIKSFEESEKRDAQTRELDVSSKRARGCHLERFVPIGNCTEHGFEETQGSEKLCTACQGIFLLNRNCFPLFVNSVICGRHERDCIYDRMSGSAQGKCRPKMLVFKVMFNQGTPNGCERWVFQHLEVPVACECYLSKRSILLEAMPPSGNIISLDV